MPLGNLTSVSVATKTALKRFARVAIYGAISGALTAGIGFTSGGGLDGTVLVPISVFLTAALTAADKYLRERISPLG